MMLFRRPLSSGRGHRRRCRRGTSADGTIRCGSRPSTGAGCSRASTSTTRLRSSTRWKGVPIQLYDVNVLVFAHRRDAERHELYRSWLEQRLVSDEPFGISEFVLSGFIRVVPRPRIFRTPIPLSSVLEFVPIRTRTNVVAIEPGERHWDIFERLCQAAAVKGSLVADAYLAALAIESGSEWITTDRDFARFTDLRWRHPIDR